MKSHNIIWMILIFCVLALVVGCNVEDECGPTTFEHGIPDDGLFYGTWRWSHSEVWEYETMTTDQHLVEVILPSSSTYESVTICIEDEFSIAENGVSTNYCITKWKSRLAHAPSDPIDDRVLQLTYSSDGSSLLMGFVFESHSVDTLVVGHPFRAETYIDPLYNGYIENFFIRTN